MEEAEHHYRLVRHSDSIVAIHKVFHIGDAEIIPFEPVMLTEGDIPDLVSLYKKVEDAFIMPVIDLSNGDYEEDVVEDEGFYVRSLTPLDQISKMDEELGLT